MSFAVGTLVALPWPPDERAAGVGVVVGLLLLWAAVTGVRLVPAHERGVVLRRGRPTRSTRPGVRLVVPGLERLVLVPAGECVLDPVVVQATNRDQTHVCVRASGRFLVHDPLRWCQSPDGYARTLHAVEEAMREDIGRTDLGDLVGYPAGREEELRDSTNRVVGAWGVELTGLEPIGVDVAADHRLLQWARALPGDTASASSRPPGAGDERACTSPRH